MIGAGMVIPFVILFSALNLWVLFTFSLNFLLFYFCFWQHLTFWYLFLLENIVVSFVDRCFGVWVWGTPWPFSHLDVSLLLVMYFYTTHWGQCVIQVWGYGKTLCLFVCLFVFLFKKKKNCLFICLFRFKKKFQKISKK